MRRRRSSELRQKIPSAGTTWSPNGDRKDGFVGRLRCGRSASPVQREGRPKRIGRSNLYPGIDEPLSMKSKLLLSVTQRYFVTWVNRTHDNLEHPENASAQLLHYRFR